MRLSLLERKHYLVSMSVPVYLKGVEVQSLVMRPHIPHEIRIYTFISGGIYFARRPFLIKKSTVNMWPVSFQW